MCVCVCAKTLWPHFADAQTLKIKCNSYLRLPKTIVSEILLFFKINTRPYVVCYFSVSASVSLTRFFVWILIVFHVGGFFALHRQNNVNSRVHRSRLKCLYEGMLRLSILMSVNVIFFNGKCRLLIVSAQLIGISCGITLQPSFELRVESIKN